MSNLNYSKKMPILSSITAISGTYPYIALNHYKHFFEKNLFILIGIFSLAASRYDDLFDSQPVMIISLQSSKYAFKNLNEIHLFE